MPWNNKGWNSNVSKELKIAWVSSSDMSLNKATYASTLTEFINVPSLFIASIHSICVVSSFLHLLSQMPLTSCDQILKGFLNQKLNCTCKKLWQCLWKYWFGPAASRTQWKGHGESAGGSVDPPHASACHQHTSASHSTNNLFIFVCAVTPEWVQNRRGNTKYFCPQTAR